MNIFEPERIKTSNFKIDNIKHSVPFTIIEPLEINNESKVIVFMNGLNGDRAWMKYFNHKIFDTNFLMSFDQKGQVENKEKPSQFFKRLINYNLKVLDYVSKFSSFKNRKIILIGESWGANCSLFMAKKRPDLFQGFLIWNMPGKIPSRNINSSKKEIMKLSFKTAFTFLTGINTKSIITFDERLTSNKILIRASRQLWKKNDNNKTSIAIYFSIRPSWKIIIKNKLKIPFVYIQSMEDIMFNEKRFNKINKNKNIIIFKKGYHILYLEDNSLLLGDEIEKFILSLSN